jgi:phage tail-like protein
MSLISGIVDGLIYPPPGFHFSVVFEMFPQTPQDIRFQSVTGLSVNTPTETIAEGGENRFKHQFPGVPQFNKLVMKRGLFLGSFVSHWARNSIQNFEFEPKNILVSLLNGNHIPLNVWHVFNAYPTKIDISEFNAEQNTLVVETLELTYQYFKPIGLDDLFAGAVGAVAGAVGGAISGSVNF